ncbi:RcnB family protein [Brevundimonas sp.]|uniref:RcnB family protein n=1 Tax=Brevundimonas sp. TaxID=1871086 RepID=UPI002EDA8613
MKRSLMVFTAIASFVLSAAAPMASLAQDQQAQTENSPGPDRAQRRAERGDRGSTPQQRRDAPRIESPQPRPDVQRPDRPDRPDRPNRPDWQGDDQRPNRPDRPDRPNRPDGADEGRPNRPDRPDRPGGQWQGRPDRPNQNWPNRPGGDYRPDRPNRPDQPSRPDRPHRPDRPDRPNWNNDRDYRDFHNRWNRDQWRRDWNRRNHDDWWRYDRRFRGWNGVRLGFYFAPGYGYYSVPRSYWNRQYYVGQYLPDIFWRYQVNDWRTYGLGYPPPGTRWVYVDNSIYLIDEYDGYIIEVIRDAWNW